jgi:hypothetical protein
MADLKLDKSFIHSEHHIRTFTTEPMLLYSNLYSESMDAAPGSYIMHYMLQMGYDMADE